MLKHEIGVCAKWYIPSTVSIIQVHVELNKDKPFTHTMSVLYPLHSPQHGFYSIFCCCRRRLSERSCRVRLVPRVNVNSSPHTRMVATMHPWIPPCLPNENGSLGKAAPPGGSHRTRRRKPWVRLHPQREATVVEG